MKCKMIDFRGGIIDIIIEDYMNLELRDKVLAEVKTTEASLPDEIEGERWVINGKCATVPFAMTLYHTAKGVIHISDTITQEIKTCRIGRLAKVLGMLFDKIICAVTLQNAIRMTDEIRYSHPRFIQLFLGLKLEGMVRYGWRADYSIRDLRTSGSEKGFKLKRWTTIIYLEYANDRYTATLEEEGYTDGCDTGDYRDLVTFLREVMR